MASTDGGTACKSAERVSIDFSWSSLSSVSRKETTSRTTDACDDDDDDAKLFASLADTCKLESSTIRSLINAVNFLFTASHCNCSVDLLTMKRRLAITLLPCWDSKDCKHAAQPRTRVDVAYSALAISLGSASFAVPASITALRGVKMEDSTPLLINISCPFGLLWAIVPITHRAAVRTAFELCDIKSRTVLKPPTASRSLALSMSEQ
mmetsp:Transcript_11420/g.17985  ORF Transcript_11420/g.17985 Transcript_11420/m.17985 type:complete len:208 (-) Transcript_11420:474-1097(-)